MRAAPFGLLAGVLLASLAPGSIAPPGFLMLRGDLHAHTCYSDGSGTPADAYRLVKEGGAYDFFAVTEHSEWLSFPFCADEACVVTPVECLATPLPSRTEWDDVFLQAEAATDASFVGLRGFEWSHPIEGHSNVFGTNEYVEFFRTPAMPAFYAWLNLPPPAGGADGIASFNHPGREPLRFDDFAYDAAGDSKMQLLEVYNRGDLYEDDYADALDRGWHVGALGVSDSHSADAWTRVRGHTLVLATGLTRPAISDGLRAMRTVGTNDPDLAVVFEAGGALMGSTIEARDFVTAQVRVFDPTTRIARIDILTNGGRVALTQTFDTNLVTWNAVLEVDDRFENWFYARVTNAEGRTAHTAPVWVT